MNTLPPYWTSTDRNPADHSTKHSVIYNPATGQPVKHVQHADPEQQDRVANLALHAFPTWSALPPSKRAQIFFRFKALLETHLDELAHLITAEHGKIISDAQGEVLRAIELVEHYCAIAQLLRGTHSLAVGTNIDCYSVRQPLGVCVGIAPFNFPVMITAWLAIPAIACGNTFIIKPSEQNPSAVIRFAELLTEAGLPDHVFNIIQGDKAVVNRLITHPRINAVNCVGSTPVAEHIYHTAIAHNKRAQAFGGAKNHAIVMPDAPIDNTITALLGAGFGAAGERCMAISVIVAVGDTVADQLKAGLTQAITQLTIGAGEQTNADMGPLISAAHRQRVIDYIAAGIDAGATLVVDGRSPPPATPTEGFFLGATLFDHVTPDMTIYQDEIFGPVLCIVRVNDYEEALNLVNQHECGNGVALFTQHGGIARDFAAQVQVGMVGINVPIPVPVAYHPFGGWKRSVFGDVHLHGDEGVRFYTKTKSVTSQWPQHDAITAPFAMPNHD